MKSTLLILFFIANSRVFACEEDLLFLLSEARQSVVNNFAKGEPCYKAALIGRTQGLPGCFPPAAFHLQSLLKPIFNRASAVCRGACQIDGKMKSCQKLVDQDYLKKVGIDFLMNSLRTSGLSTDIVHWDAFELEATIDL